MDRVQWSMGESQLMEERRREGVVRLTNSIEDEANLFVVVQVLHEKFLRVLFEVGEFAGGDGQHLLRQRPPQKKSIKK
jgi:hypothetical protein